MKRIILPIVTTFVSLILFGILLFFRGITEAKSGYDVIRIVSDAALIPGIINIAIGAFLLVSDEGLFAGAEYTVKRIWNSLHDEKYQKANKQSYYEFREAKRKKKAPALVFFSVGAGFLLVTIILVIIYVSA